MDKKTALYNKHIAAGGKMVPFARYLLPVQYQNGIIFEHTSVRNNAGIFDVSHMGEIVLTGRDALANVNNLMTNDFTDMQDGQIRYSPMCYENGGTVDDLLVYKCEGEKYFIVVNAANKDKDADWMRQNLFGDVKLEDCSADISQVALQGPKSFEILGKLADKQYIPEHYYSFVENAFIREIPCIISKTGYTGEDGYEIYCENRFAENLWELLLHAGEETGLIPCGLGARDTLRLEAGMPLYGHELSAEISPKEAGLSYFIKMGKPSFVGKEALAGERTRKRIALKLVDRGVAREGSEVFLDGKKVGFVTSGTFSPTLGYAIAMALITASTEGGTFEIDVRGKKLKAEAVKLPFYKAKK